MSAVARHLAERFLAPHERRAVDVVLHHFGAGGRPRFEGWSEGGIRSIHEADDDADYPSDRLLGRYLRHKPWVAPHRPICFLTDLHADREAFWRSLLVAGMVETGGGASNVPLESIPDAAFGLSEFGSSTHLVIGGDLFDKGPANLPLLDAIGTFLETGVEFTLLAGNHDVRTYLGIRHAGAKDPRLAHLFVRMGKKSVTLLKEVFDAELAGGDARGRLRDDEVRERLFPSDDWFEAFPRLAEGLVPPARIDKELRRIREKMAELEGRCLRLGMTLGDLDAAVERCRSMFLEEDGRFAWLFGGMRIAHREGSMLFAHAGVDDEAAIWLSREGVESLQASFLASLETSPFELYNGSLGNMFRTKYRDLDLPLTGVGRAALHRAGIYAIVHGHRNVFLGQHMNFRRGLLNFACDACVDRNTRSVEGLAGAGSAATLIAEDGTIYGLSADHPAIKVFDPAAHGGWVTRP